MERDAEARILRPKLDLALAVADVEIRASCFVGGCESKGTQEGVDVIVV